MEQVIHLSIQIATAEIEGHDITEEWETAMARADAIEGRFAGINISPVWYMLWDVDTTAQDIFPDQDFDSKARRIIWACNVNKDWECLHRVVRAHAMMDEIEQREVAIQMLLLQEDAAAEAEQDAVDALEQMHL